MNAAFRHYLNCLHDQAENAELGTFDDTVARYEDMLNSAETLLATLAARRIRGQQRDFGEIIDVNRAALAVLASTGGRCLGGIGPRSNWASLLPRTMVQRQDRCRTNRDPQSRSGKGATPCHTQAKPDATFLRP